MKILVMPYKAGSAGCRAICDALGLRQVRLANSTLRGSHRTTLINWGSSSFHNNPQFEACKVLNHPSEVTRCSNKLEFFRNTDPELCVPWTTEIDKVREWAAEGKSVFARRTLNGHSGAGIIELTQDNTAEWREAPLYTLYVPKESEFRVHFFRKKVIDIQKKCLKRTEAVVNENTWKVRNLANGFVFARHFGDPPQDVLRVAETFIAASALDFGAIDIIYNRRRDKAYILEVNTAPGLAGSTVDSYKTAIEEYQNAQI